MLGESKQPDRPDSLFAREALRKEVLKQDDLERALAMQKQLESRGEKRRLHSLLIETGGMSAGQVREVLAHLEQNFIPCPGCGATFPVGDLPPGKKFLCKRCKTVVVVPGGSDAGSTPAPHELVRTVAVPSQTPSGKGDDLSGRVVGGCRVDHLIGEGGMGAVYMAIQESLGRPVALKILSQSLSSNEEYITRFEREARAVAVLNHPNIVQVHDMGRDPEGFYFIVMEYVEGTTLSELVKTKGLLDEKFSLRAIRQACLGLHAAHEAGILHRDVKPENLMVSKEGRVKVADFGLAKETAGDSQLTGTGTALGTPAYMAPEQGMGESPDRRSDIYSLGGTLFTLLTGHLPYEAKSPLSMMMKHATDPVPEVRKENAAVSEVTEALIGRAMAKEPGDRFQDLSEMKGAVQQSLDALSASKSKPAPAKAGGPSVPKRASAPGRSLTPKTPVERKPSSRRGARAPDAPAKTPTPAKRRAPETPAKKRGPETPRSGAPASRRAHPGGKSGRTPAVRKKGGGGKAVGIVAAMALVLLLGAGGAWVILSGGSSGGTAGDGGKEGTSETGPEKGGGTAEDPSEDGNGGGGETDPAPSDEPEGPAEPPALPSGIRAGERPGEYVNEKDGQVLVYVPAGRVMLGLSEKDLDWIRRWFPALDLERHRMTMPARSVYLDGFFIGKHEVTNEQYEIFLDWYKGHPAERERYAHPASPAGNSPQSEVWNVPGFTDLDAPVVGIDWFDAWAYAHWAGLDLPTQAQWEKAAVWDPEARQRRRFPWGDEATPRAALCADRLAGKLFGSAGEAGRWRRGLSEDAKRRVHPGPVSAERRDVSAVGAVGLGGNVSEWCRDYYHHSYYRDPDSDRRNAYDAAFYPGRVVRGTNFREPLEHFFPRIGYFAEEGLGLDFIGFRCAKPLVMPLEDVLGSVDEAVLQSLDDPVKKRTVMGLLEAMKRNDNWHGVIRRARWALDRFPGETDFHLRLASAFLQTQKVNDALFRLEEALSVEKLDSRRATLHYTMGRAFWQEGNPEGASGAFSRSIEINPHQFDAFYWRGKIRLEKLRRYEDAVSDFLDALAYARSDAGVALHGIALCKKKLGDRTAALRYFDEAVKASPRNRFFLFDRGTFLLETGDPDKAREDFETLIALKDFTRGYLGMARYFDKRDQQEKALRAVERGLNARNPTSSSALEDLRELKEKLSR